jgi:hypothetical protein
MCDRFFTQKTGASICTHPLDGCGYGWRSAVVASMRGRVMCWTVQEKEKEQGLVTHTVVRIDQMRDRGTEAWRRYDVNGRVVLMQNMGPVT